MDLSLIDGLTLISRWQTLVVIGGYLILTSLPYTLSGYLAAREKSNSSMMSGCLALLVIRTVQAVVLFAALLTLVPIIAGTASHAAWTLPFEVARRQPIQIVKAVEIVFFCSLAASLLPYISRSESFNIIVSGIVATGLAFKAAARHDPSLTLASFGWLPLDAVVIGLMVIITAIVMWFSFLTAGTVATLIRSPSLTVTEIVNHVIGSLFGFIPLALYWTWLGSQIKPGS